MHNADISSIFDHNSLFKCALQHEVTKIYYLLFLDFKVVQGHWCWYFRQGY